jgi:thiol-disulfide isomerase/thioredoxin
MKKLFIVVVYLLFSSCLMAQNKTDNGAPYLKDKNLPAFNLLLPDSTYFTPDQLPKYDFTTIIYFSPDCGHCQHTAKELVHSMDSLKNVFFVFVAYKSLDDIKGFASYYGLDKFQNVRFGRDPKYYVPSFYRVEATPFVAIYNRNRELVKVFDPPHSPVMEIADLLKVTYK